MKYTVIKSFYLPAYIEGLIELDTFTKNELLEKGIISVNDEETNKYTVKNKELLKETIIDVLNILSDRSINPSPFRFEDGGSERLYRLNDKIGDKNIDKLTNALIQEIESGNIGFTL